MGISIVPFYAALLALFFIILSGRVIRIRRQERIGVGDSNNMRLRRAIRVHGNFAEYVPISLILAAFVETRQFSPIMVHALCLILIAGRICHAYGVSQEKEDYRFRVMGMVLTFTTIGISAMLLVGSFAEKIL